MKLERLHESLLPFFVIGGGLVLAIFVGAFAGGGEIGRVGLVLAGIVALLLLLIVRERIWMIIPATLMLSGKVSALPLPFSVNHLGIFFAFGGFLLLKAFKIIRLKPRVGLVEVWLYVVLAYLLTVFIRNPVGVESLGSDRVGGKPYFDVAVAFAGYWVLSRSVASPREAFFVPLLSIVGHGFTVALNVIANRFPSTIAPLAQLYSGIAAAESLDPMSTAVPGEESTRQGYLQGFGSNLFLVACSFWRPFTIVNPLYFGRFFVFLVSVVCVLISGFRSAVMAMLVIFMLSTYFRRGGMAVFRSGLFAVLLLGTVVLFQGVLIDLPLSVQRSLSFLPGRWDYEAKSDAEWSTEWRLQMWKTMMFTDRYIQNKWLGDGFGFTRRQLAIMAANSQTGSNVDQQENLMISGGVHSGPVSSIRFVGYVGFILFLIFIILMAFRAAHLIRRAQNTPFFSMALFLCLPVVWYPVSFLFIFGGYEGDLPYSIITVGLQKLLENSLDAYAPEKKEEQTPAPIEPARKFRRPPQFIPV